MSLPAVRVPVPLPVREARREVLVVLDFDGLLINSYELLKSTFEHFGLDVGDEERFRKRRKFLKYLGGGRELARNLVRLSLPKEKKIRERLTDEYIDRGRVYSEFEPLLNRLIESPAFHVGVVSRNFTYTPGLTIRTVLRRSGINEQDLDFVIPIPTGAKKGNVLDAMRAARYTLNLFAADEIGDYKAATEAGYEVLMSGYGFDSRKRLIEEAGTPPEIIFDTPGALAEQLARRVGPYLP